MWRDEWKGRTVWAFGPSAPKGNGVIWGQPSDSKKVYVCYEDDTFQLPIMQLIDERTGWRLDRYFTGRGHRKGGKTRKDTWSVIEQGMRHFYAERVMNGKYENENLSAHCLACAKTEILSKHGGKVDIRGWHKQGHCGLLLKAMTIAMEQEND